MKYERNEIERHNLQEQCVLSVTTAVAGNVLNVDNIQWDLVQNYISQFGTRSYFSCRLVSTIVYLPEVTKRHMSLLNYQ